MQNQIHLEKDKVYKIPGPFGATIFAKYITETEQAYHFEFNNKGWKDYPGHILKKDIDKIKELNNL